jgi:ElaB/YqjD/DUF883 family membrane-anchored ribosome-binding protein
MSTIENDSTTRDELTAASEPFSIGDVDTASDAVAARTTDDTVTDCRLQPTAEPDESDAGRAKEPDQLSGSVLANLAEGARDGLEAAAEYVRTTDGRQMLATLETFIKNNPGVSLTVAAAFGFVVGRSIRRDKPTST